MVHTSSIETLLESPNSDKLEIILKEINESSLEKLEHNENLIWNWIKCQPHFPKNIDKGFVRGMLRANKHILEKTKMKIEQHLAARHLYPEIYNNWLPFSKDIVHAMDVVNITLMPQLTFQGYRLLIFSLNRLDPIEFSYPSALKLFLMIYELVLSSDKFAAGDIAIFDAANFSAGHFAKFFGPFMRTQVTIMREAYSVRLKEVHIINGPSIMMKMVSALRPILHAKVRNAISIHQDSSFILQRFGAENIPSNYGGNLKTSREIAMAWYDALNSNSEWLESMENVKIVDTAIPKTIRNKFQSRDVIGLEGSFRKLELD